MPIDVTCPQCGGELEAPDEAAGKKVKCPDCGERIAVPPTGGAIQPPPAPGPAERAARAEKKEEVQEERPRRRDRAEEEEEEDRPRRRRRDEDDEEDEDDRPRRRRRREDEDYDDAGVATLIPYKNGKALAAYYCGVFSFIPCAGNILGPIALVFGILGLRFAREHPRARGAGHAWSGIIMGTFTTLLWWVGPLVLMALGWLSK
jgi:hypothetical protein